MSVQQVIFYLVEVVALTISCALFYMLLRGLYYRRQNGITLSWPQVRGKILSSELVEDSDKSNTFQPRIRYIYNVNGKDYESTTYSLGMDYLGEKQISQDICNEYSNLDETSVSYNPVNPAISVLKPGITEFNERSFFWEVLFFFLFSPVHLSWVVLYFMLFVW